MQPIVSNKEIQLNNKKITGNKKVKKIKSNNSDLVTTNRTQSFVEVYNFILFNKININ